MSLKIECAAQSELIDGKVYELSGSFTLKTELAESISSLLIDEDSGKIDYKYIKSLHEDGDKDGILWKALHSSELQDAIDNYLLSNLKKLVKADGVKASLVHVDTIILKNKSIICKENVICEYAHDINFEDYVFAKIFFKSKKSKIKDFVLDLDNDRLCEILLCDKWSAKAKFYKQKEYERDYELFEIANSRLSEVIITEMGFDWLTDRRAYNPERVEIFEANGNQIYHRSFD